MSTLLSGKTNWLAISSLFVMLTGPLFADAPVRPASVSEGPESTARLNSSSSVIKVRREGAPRTPEVACYAKRGDSISIDVLDLDRWLMDPALQKRLPVDRDPGLLVPFINGNPLPGIYADKAEYYDYEDGAHTVRTLTFRLTRNEKSKDAWDKLLNRPVFVRAMELSVGFENGEHLPTWVLPKAKNASHFELILIPRGRFLAGAVVIFGSFLLFGILARSTDIVRDSTAKLRPDGKRPYSLARAQMAFWFFLVIASFFFLWIITGDMDTLTESVLALIGISAATALGAAFIDAAKPPTDNNLGKQRIDFGQPREAVATQYREQIVAAKKKLDELQEEKPTSSNPEANQLAQDALHERIEELTHNADYFRWPPWKGVMHDLLSENGLISFHRFQMMVWTLVLGIIFVVSVYAELAMPQFSGTLLGLMGISAGTYVGFKLPEPRK